MKIKSWFLFSRNKKCGFTLIELIITIVVLAIVMIPVGLISIEYIRGIGLSRQLAAAESLAKTEMSKVNNLAYNDVTNSNVPNYEGYPYDLQRIVNYVAGSNNNLKEVQIKIYPSGDAINCLVNLKSYVANTPFGVGSAGLPITIP